VKIEDPTVMDVIRARCEDYEKYGVRSKRIQNLVDQYRKGLITNGELVEGALLVALSDN
jgi:hypothetical protein